MSPDVAYEEGLPRAARRATGAYYTPPALVAQVLDEVLAPQLRGVAWRADGSPELRVLDPAAGSGRFLLACVERLTTFAAARGFEPKVARHAIVARCVVGIERDPTAAALAREALGPRADVRVGEALFGRLVPDRAWDVVVGNPPYVRSIALKRDDPQLWQRLRGAFAATSYGEWDLSAAFIERTLDWLAADGRAGLVVPSRWLTATYAGPLRQLLAARGAVRKVVDFGAAQLFPGATTYVALVFLDAHGAKVVEVEKEGRQGLTPAADLGAAPWVLAAGVSAERLRKLSAAGPPLGDVARIAKGAGTNADPVFLLDEAMAAELEPAALVPCLRGRDVAPYVGQVVRHALLPYDSGGKLLAPDQLARTWPRAASYLNEHRAILERRERGRFSGPTYYCWGRPQNLTWLRSPAPKIVVPDAAHDGRATLDQRGTLVIDTAYAIRPQDLRSEVLGLILAVLNSPVVAEWLRATGIPLRGGYFRMKTAYLASLPLPDPASRGAREVARMALSCGPDDVVRQEEIARRVLRLYESGPS